MKKINFFLAIVLLSLGSCKKNVTVDDPVNTITTKQTFSSESTATSAVVAIYSQLIRGIDGVQFGNGGITLFVGRSADELSLYGFQDDEFANNSLAPENGGLSFSIWKPAYFTIYQSNICIEGLEQSTTLKAEIKNQLIGECKFLRAFSYFYLVNLFGDVPLLTTSDWRKTYLLNRTDKSEIYGQIVLDLEDAKIDLVNNYSFSFGERVRANKFSAAALLARVYLYMGNWSKAQEEASIVIDNMTLYNLENNLDSVFLNSSREAILQVQPTNLAYPYAIEEPRNMIPIYGDPIHFLTDSLLNAFEVNDLRRANWVNSVVSSGLPYYYPYKYKVSEGLPGSAITEYYMLLRLAEQYLVRAEAKAKQNKLVEAIADINVVRNRAGLPSLSSSLSLADILTSIEQERRVELFAEWGHRWFDLIRTNRANTVLGSTKAPNWQPTDQLYPIPLSEMQLNPNLVQNPGY